MRFLTQPWAQAVTAALAADPRTAAATGEKDVVMAFQITACPPDLGGGDLTYFTRAQDGVVTVGIGSPPEPMDMESTMSYETAASLSQGRLDPRTAALARRIESTVGVMKIMKYAPVLSARLRAEQSLTGVEY